MDCGISCCCRRVNRRYRPPSPTILRGVYDFKAGVAGHTCIAPTVPAATTSTTSTCCYHQHHLHLLLPPAPPAPAATTSTASACCYHRHRQHPPLLRICTFLWGGGCCRGRGLGLRHGVQREKGEGGRNVCGSRSPSSPSRLFFLFLSSLPPRSLLASSALRPPCCTTFRGDRGPQGMGRGSC